MYCPATEDFFRARLDHMIDLRHELAVLSSRMRWQELEASVAHLFSRKARAGKQLNRQAGGYAHARQFKRMRGVIKRQRTIVGRLQREIERKACRLSQAVQQALGLALNKASQIVAQSAQRKNVSGMPKLYAWQAPEVSCISKGKARQPYEFGVKVGIATTLKGNLIVGARAFHGNPYDGHTLNEQLEQAGILMQDRANKPTSAFVDLGYRGVDADNPGVRVVHRGKSKRLSKQERKLLKRRQAIEPIIGHLKADHRMDRCHLQGEQGDCLHAVLCAAGYNIRWLLRMIIKKGLRPFLRLLRQVLPAAWADWFALTLAKTVFLSGLRRAQLA